MPRPRRTLLKPRSMGLVFVLAVILPSVLLAALSLRAAAREESFMEQQLRAALSAEVNHAAALAAAEAKKTADALKAGLPAGLPQDPKAALARWQDGEPLVDVPFLLSSRFLILWPPPDGPLADKERAFLEETSDFLADRASTPVFKNIALVYQADILEQSRKQEEKTLGAAEGEAALAEAKTEQQALPEPESPAARNLEPGGMRGGAADDSSAAFAAPASARSEKAKDAPAALPPVEDQNQRLADKADLRKAPAQAAEEPLAAQKALDIFAQSESVRESVYTQAAKKGGSVGTRVVEPAPVVQKAPAESRRSQFVSEQERLSAIAAQAGSGIIPRLVGDRLTFLFYSRLRDGRIIGCRLDSARFRERITAAIPGTWTPTRILVILDEKGTPLSAPGGSEGRDWRRPFASQEIGEGLPRWEAASYLTDPTAVAARARTTGLIVALLVVILIASVAGGGTLVLTSLSSESRLARNKATFVTNVSHELKTPLTSIRLFVDMLRQGRQKDPARAAEYLTRIGSETERLTRLINSVLDFSALERGTRRYTPAPGDLASLCAGVVDGERPRLEASGFAVELSAHGGECIAMVDPEGLKQVLLNLLSNAEKYSPGEKRIELSVERQGGMCAVCVSDRGIGVPERLREKIFQEFFRVDDSLTSRAKGTGLGLTIARKVARDLGGDLVCGARDGGGSMFILTLPAVEVEA
jgi:signal transduction histidine kinase